MLFHESNIIKIIKLGVYAVLFLPLIVVPLLFFPFSTSKAFLFQAIVEIIFALYFIVALKNPEYRPKKTLLFYAVSFYFIALLLSAVFGLDFYHSFFGNYERMWGFFQLLHFFFVFRDTGRNFQNERRLVEADKSCFAFRRAQHRFWFISIYRFFNLHRRLSQNFRHRRQPGLFRRLPLFPALFF